VSGARTVLAAGLVVLAQVLDVAVLARCSFPGAVPDLTLLVVVALALLGGPTAGAAAGICAGLVADLTPPAAGLLGLGAIGYGLAGLVAGRWHRPGERSLLVPVLAAVGASCTLAAVQGVTALFGGRGLGDVLGTAAASVAYAAVGALVVVPLVVLLDRVVEGEQAEAVRL
jgi:rod shape-determining protein MreD